MPRLEMCVIAGRCSLAAGAGRPDAERLGRRAFSSRLSRVRESIRVDERPAVRTLSDLHVFVIDRQNLEAHFVFLHFQQLGGNRDALADPGGRHVAHVHVNPHGLLVLIQKRRHQTHASSFHKSDHRRRGKNIRCQLARAHLLSRHVGLLVYQSRYQSVFHGANITRERREATVMGAVQFGQDRDDKLP